MGSRLASGRLSEPARQTHNQSYPAFRSRVGAPISPESPSQSIVWFCSDLVQLGAWPCSPLGRLGSSERPNGEARRASPFTLSVPPHVDLNPRPILRSGRRCREHRSTSVRRNPLEVALAACASVWPRRGFWGPTTGATTLCRSPRVAMDLARPVSDSLRTHCRRPGPWIPGRPPVEVPAQQPQRGAVGSPWKPLSRPVERPQPPLGNRFQGTERAD